MFMAAETIIHTAFDRLNEVALQLRARFAESAFLSLRSLQVNSDEDCVVVEGEVATYHLFQVAVSIMRELAGDDIGIESRISVVPPGARRKPVLICSQF